MASAPPTQAPFIPEPMQAPEPTAAPQAAAQIMVCVGRSFAEPGAAETYQKLMPLLESLALLSGAPVLLAHPSDPSLPGDKLRSEHIQLIPYASPADAGTLWLQTAADYRMARELLSVHQCVCCLMLGAEAADIEPTTLRTMVHTILQGEADLAVPCYETDMDEALLNNVLLYPLSRAVYAADINMPLPVDLAMSARLCERMGSLASRVATAAQSGTLLWPVAEASAAGYTIAEVAGRRRPELHMGATDLKTVMALIAGSLFSDVEARAQFWQRSRPPAAVLHRGNPGKPVQEEELDRSEAATLVDTFKLGYQSLHEIWALVLPPNSLLGLKKLSLQPAESFRMSDALWVRVVYDFLLAHRLRTINRGHLLGALTPLYLAWVATYVMEVASPADARKRFEALATAFDADKPYLVSRWRWPDRFNP